jgi:hypothetical protein
MDIRLTLHEISFRLYWSIAIFSAPRKYNHTIKYCSLLKLNELTKSKYHIYIDEMTKMVEVVAWLVYGVHRHFQQYFSYIVATTNGRRQKETSNRNTELYYMLLQCVMYIMEVVMTVDFVKSCISNIRLR